MGSLNRVTRAVGCALVLLTCLLTLAGCRPSPEPASAIPPLAGTEPNGEQKRTGAQLLGDARTAVRSAGALSMTGTLALGGREPTVDLLVGADGSVSGTLTMGTGSLQVQTTGTALYVRPTGTAQPVTELLGLPDSVARSAPGNAFWQLNLSASPELLRLAQPALSSSLLPASLVAAPGLGSGDVDGTPVVTATAGRVTAYVGVTGDTQLVRLTDGAGGDLRLTVVMSTPPPPLVTPAAVPAP